MRRTALSDTRKVLLIDGHSLAYRAFFALPATMTTAGGQPVNAIYGFTSMLLKVLGEEKPDAVVVALDGPRSGLLRTAEYAEYKSHRPTMPDELRTQMEMIEHLLGHMHIPVVTSEGHEADDVLGTIARAVSSRGSEAVIVTGDRDTLQLVRPGVRVLMTSRGISETVSYDEAAVTDRYGVPPERLPDVAALKGDASDNIPGVPGIGEKGAVDLIRRYGSLESLYENLDEVTGARRKSALQENRELAFLCRKLSSIVTDVPLDLDVDAVRFADWDRHEVLDYLSSLEFKTLAARFLEMYGTEMGGAQAAAHSEKLAPALVDAGDESELTAFSARARDEGAVGLAAVLSGSGFCEVRLEGLALATLDTVLIAVDAPALTHARSLVESSEVEKWAHDAKPALEAMGLAGWTPAGFTFDTAIAAYLDNPSLGRYAVAEIWQRNLGGDIAIVGLDAGPGRAEQPSLLDEPGGRESEKQAEAALEAVMVCHLKPVLAERLESAGMAGLERDVERPFMFVLKEMEEAGVKLDAEALDSMSREAAGAIAALEREICGLAGREFKISSTRQLAEVLFRDLGLPAGKKTKTGYSTDASVLDSLRGCHDIVQKVIEYREAAKLKSTYFDVLPSLVCPRTGRLHCQFNQTATTTGRISSSNPNLQNIPVRTEAGRKIRRAFVAGEVGWKLLVADYSQIELRVLAHESRDPLLIEAFMNDRDVHAETASIVFGVPATEVTGEMRRMAKVVNFGVVYGMGYYGLSSRLGLSMEEATAYIDTYFRTYEGVRAYREACVERALMNGYAVTLLGRRRFIPELASENRQTREVGERLAINTPLQGSAADIIKKAMVAVSGAFRTAGMSARMTVQIHDEIIVEAPGEEVDEAARILTSNMSGAVDLVVPLKVEHGVYDNWGQAKS